MAFPPPLIRGTCTGPPAPITTIGEARKARRQQILEARASKEVCPVRAIQDKTPEITKGEMNTMEIVTPSTAPNDKGTGNSVPQTQANTAILSQDAQKGNSKGEFLGRYFIKKGKNPFILADVVPEPSKEDSSNTNDSWRGFRRSRDPSATQQPTWEGNAKWPSWNNWKE